MAPIITTYEYGGSLHHNTKVFREERKNNKKSSSISDDFETKKLCVNAAFMTQVIHIWRCQKTIRRSKKFAKSECQMILKIFPYIFVINHLLHSSSKCVCGCFITLMDYLMIIAHKMKLNRTNHFYGVYKRENWHTIAILSVKLIYELFVLDLWRVFWN